jgi:peroxiredoxin
MHSDNKPWLVLFLILLAGCGSMMDDLSPSGNDKRPVAQPGTTGPAVGQKAPDFTVSDTLGNTVTLSSELTPTAVNGVVFYFTMWCPICDGHMSHMLNTTMPLFPNVRFFAVDYVSGSVDGARSSEIANGYAGSGLRILADTGHSILDAYSATMGTTVVIDSTGVIRLNEDYKDGAQLHTVLTNLQ